MAARRVLNPNLTNVWLTQPKETYPVLASIAVAIGWCGYMSARHLFTSPDVSLSPARRNQPLKDVAAEAEAWVSSHRKHVAKDVSNITIFSPVEKKYANMK